MVCFESESCSVVWVPWTIQSMEFSRPEHLSGQPFLSPGDLPNQGIKPRSPTLQADSLPSEPINNNLTNGCPYSLVDFYFKNCAVKEK